MTTTDENYSNQGVESRAVRAVYLDASALVKLYVKEEDSDRLEKFVQKEANRYTTTMCFYETLNVLKRKWLKKQISKEEYLKTSLGITAWFSFQPRFEYDVDLLNRTDFYKVEEVVKKYDLDISDAFQIVSVRDGPFSHLVDADAPGCPKNTLLVTADKKLAEVARKEGIRSWFITEEPPP